MGHRKWDEYIWVTTGNLREEHNDTVDAWQAAVAEAERLGRANSDLCDQIAAIRVPFTDAQIGRVARSLWGNTCGDWSHTAIRAALSAGGLESCAVPEPVGWELDVTADEALRVYSRGGKSIGGMHNVLDLCRSRIRPVFECKECRQWRNANDELVRRATAARAALEGES